MKVHTIKSPFMCRPGQFTDGKQDLCVGIQVDALKSKDIHRIQLGTKMYDINTKDALVLATQKNSFFKGGTVAIVPFLLVSQEVK